VITFLDTSHNSVFYVASFVAMFAESRSAAPAVPHRIFEAEPVSFRVGLAKTSQLISSTGRVDSAVYSIDISPTINWVRMAICYLSSGLTSGLLWRQLQ
jgi:hypothetical protein